MAEELKLSNSTDKEQIYREILPQIEAVTGSEPNLIANLANIAAILNEAFTHLWTGFYLRDGDDLVLGPFQGPLACTRIPLKPKAKGVCGAAADQKTTIIVPNVHEFPGHIACSSASQSEIVVPLTHNNQTELVLDIDSKYLNKFNEIDALWLEKIIGIIKNNHYG